MCAVDDEKTTDSRGDGGTKDLFQKLALLASEFNRTVHAMLAESRGKAVQFTRDDLFDLPSCAGRKCMVVGSLIVYSDENDWSEPVSSQRLHTQ